MHYLLLQTWGGYESHTVRGVFVSEEGAMAHVQDRVEAEPGWSQGDTYRIELWAGADRVGHIDLECRDGQVTVVGGLTP